ncbi:hypothetical protein [Elizabethkingia anophelis]|uniref:hypothetical protein n=1 Tax=Elizabethkingia anophelis TaxID=1117645 RepID=UPI0029273281|nr:MAG: hypothetical protein PQ275_09030 [Elizabethkingia anophelis]
MKNKKSIEETVAKAKRLFLKVSSQKWFKKVIRQVLLYLIQNRLDDIITWSKHILEMLFNDF